MVEAAPVSQQKRKRIEEPLAGARPSAGSHGPCYGVSKSRFQIHLAMASYNLIRLPKLIETTASPVTNTRYFGEPSMMHHRPRPAGSDLRERLVRMRTSNQTIISGQQLPLDPVTD